MCVCTERVFWKSASTDLSTCSWWIGTPNFPYKHFLPIQYFAEIAVKFKYGMTARWCEYEAWPCGTYGHKSLWWLYWVSEIRDTHTHTHTYSHPLPQLLHAPNVHFPRSQFDEVTFDLLSLWSAVEVYGRSGQTAVVPPSVAAPSLALPFPHDCFALYLTSLHAFVSYKNTFGLPVDWPRTKYRMFYVHWALSPFEPHATSAAARFLWFKIYTSVLFLDSTTLSEI